MDICVCMAEFLCCPLETITTLVISYTPKQNKKLKEIKKKTSKISCSHLTLINESVLVDGPFPESALVLRKCLITARDLG